VYASLKEEKYVVTVPRTTASLARKALDRMFELS
jgi:quinolinate synthase